MDGTPPQDFKELVHSRTDIVQLIGETVALHPEQEGRAYRGVCPFHDDYQPSRTVKPSLTVNHERRSYKCWACGEGGDCFSFLMKRDNIGFREALEFLARRAHLEFPDE